MTKPDSTGATPAQDEGYEDPISNVHSQPLVQVEGQLRQLRGAMDRVTRSQRVVMAGLAATATVAVTALVLTTMAKHEAAALGCTPLSCAEAGQVKDCEEAECNDGAYCILINCKHPKNR
jgi:hypothetical protein